MRKDSPQHPRCFQAPIIQVTQLRQVRYLACLRIQSEVLLQLPSELICQQ